MVIILHFRDRDAIKELQKAKKKALIVSEAKKTPKAVLSVASQNTVGRFNN